MIHSAFKKRKKEEEQSLENSQNVAPIAFPTRSNCVFLVVVVVLTKLHCNASKFIGCKTLLAHTLSLSLSI